MPGKIRVGRSKYENGRTIYPRYEGYSNVIVLVKGYPEYGDLGPYNLTNNKGQIIENVWQFSKVYERVPYASIPFSSKYKQIVWEHKAETHIDANGNLTQEFWNWRSKGMNNPMAVRNPVGWNHMKECKFALEFDCPISETNPPLGYIDARKKIYLKIYMDAVRSNPRFKELRQRLKTENLLIIEVDGPHQESMGYYKSKYNVADDFIIDDSIEATEHNLAILLNDEKHPFGHGYCLAWSLMVLPE